MPRVVFVNGRITTAENAPDIPATIAILCRRIAELRALESGEFGAESSITLTSSAGQLFDTSARSASRSVASRFTATTDGQSVLAGGRLAMPGATRFTRPTDRTAANALTDDNVDGSVTTFRLKNLYLSVSVAPGASKAWTMSLRRNTSSPAGTPSVTVNDSETIDGDQANSLEITSSDMFSLQIVLTNTPSAVGIGRWSPKSRPTNLNPSPNRAKP